MSTTQPTQAKHPWRATARTILALGVSSAIFLPQIVDASGVDQTGWIAGLLAGAGLVTRLMAIPEINQLLAKVGLGAAPKSETPSA